MSLPMKIRLIVFVFLLSMGCSQSLSAQNNADDKADEQIEKKAADWVASLQLADAAKAQKVTDAIALHLKTIRTWNNEHPYTIVPAGIDPATGNRLSNLDRQVIANSAMPASIHQNLVNVLNAELTLDQVEAILDKYTIGKVEFTMKGYKAIVPDLTSEEEAKILSYLKQAREEAIDFKNMKQVSAIFEIYKTKCEQYLNGNGRNWHQLYKDYVNKIKAQKAAEKKENNS